VRRENVESVSEKIDAGLRAAPADRASGTKTTKRMAAAILWASDTPVQNTEETLVHEATPTPATTKVGDIVAGDYRTAAVFEKHGIDFCCGGSVTLAAACAEKAIDPAALASELEAATSVPARRDQDYAGWTPTHLINHIKAIHHAYVKANAAQNAAYARKIAAVHGYAHPELPQIVTVYDKMATALMVHLKQEEEVVFPAIKRAEAAGRAGSAPEAGDVETIAHGVEALVREHDEVGAALHEIRELAMPRTYDFPAYGVDVGTIARDPTLPLYDIDPDGA
jgi:regulator of cell morphogenesis and NO signaling